MAHLCRLMANELLDLKILIQLCNSATQATMSVPWMLNWLWYTEPVDSLLACLTLLNINSCYIERAVLVVVVSVCSVWCLIFDPSRIILTKAKSEGGTASLWQSAWNDPSIFLKHFSAHYLCSSR